MKWFRHRRNRPALQDRALADTWQLVSLLLDYPDEEMLQRLPLFRSVAANLPTPQRDLITAYLTTLETTPLGELQADYVDTFDVTRKCSLHLTYFTHGDTRRRGVALVEFRQAFRNCGVELDIAARTATVDGRPVDLSAREFALARELITHAGQALSRDQLLDRVWGFEVTGSSNVVDVYVRYLRAKVGTDRISTVRGVGYRFEA